MGSGGGPPHRTAATASPTQSAVAVASPSAPDPPSRTVASLGAGAGQRMSRAPSATSYVIEYQVTFIESGLPSPMNWSIIFNTTGTNPVKETSNTSSITFGPYRNGTYSFTVGSVAGYAASPMSGNVTVSGKNVQLSIAFHPFTYSVTFTESGLLPGTTWRVTLNGSTQSSTGSTLTFTEPNGTYSFTVSSPGYQPSPASGSLTVKGAAVSQAVTFTQVTYTVTFTETGLPASTNWSVTLNGVLQSSATDTITFTEPNGSYAYAVGNVPGWHITTGSYRGSITVNGGPESESMTFSAFTYGVTFTESGLPTGTSWSVTLGGLLQNSATSAITFQEPNGTHSFTVGSVAGYTARPSSGSVTVSAAAVSEAITFAPTAVATYTVTFTESGLPASTSWSVTLNGSPQSSTGPTVTFTEPNGTYSFTVSSSGYQPSPASGSLTVKGAAVSQAVTFTQVTYTVTFTETGLPSGTMWYLNVTGQTPVISIGATASISLPNGTYDYGIATGAMYAATSPGGAVTVAGAATRESITFVGAFEITFNRPSATPVGGSWTVYLNSTTGPGIVRTTSSGSLAIRMPNGTYSYSIVVPGSPSLTTRGTVVVQGSNVVANPSSATPSTFMGFPGTTGYYILAAVIVGLVLALAAVWALRRRPGKG